MNNPFNLWTKLLTEAGSEAVEHLLLQLAR